MEQPAETDVPVYDPPFGITLDEALKFIAAEGRAPIVQVSRIDEDAVDGGGFTDIWRGRLSQGDIVAMKVARVTFQGARLFKLLAREVRIWSKLKHSNILPFLGLSLQRTSRPLCLVSPWMENGHINNYLKAMPDADRIQLIVGIRKGLSYLHGNNIVHGDVKGANIFVDSHGEALLADFGLSWIQDDLAEEGLAQTTSSALAGSTRWKAPERFIPKDYGLTHQTSRQPPSDVYSLGMTIYEIMSGSAPFQGMNDTTVFLFVMQGGRPKHPGSVAVQRGLHNTLWSFVTRSWQANPASRPSLEDLQDVLGASFEGPAELTVGLGATSTDPSEPFNPDGYALQQGAPRDMGMPNPNPQQQQAVQTGQQSQRFAQQQYQPPSQQQQQITQPAMQSSVAQQQGSLQGLIAQGASPNVSQGTARAHGLLPSPGRPGRTPLARHESLRRVRTYNATCGFCRKQNESGARYCAGCGESLLVSVSPPYWDTLRSDLPKEKPHPMGKEALVSQLGKPTKKMEAFADALLELLCQEVPSRHRLVDIPRLKYLERAFDRQAQFTLPSLRQDFIVRIFKSLAFEHEIISSPPPMSDSCTPALTQRGLLTYLVHTLLYEPDEAIREFNSILAQGKVPPPPRWLGGKTWHMERRMALAVPHPDAIRVNKQMMYDLQNYFIMYDGWDVRANCLTMGYEEQ